MEYAKLSEDSIDKPGTTEWWHVANAWAAFATAIASRDRAFAVSDVAERADCLMAEFRRRFVRTAPPEPTRAQKELAVAREYETPTLPPGGHYQLAYILPGGLTYLVPGTGHNKYEPGHEGKYGLIFSTKKQFHPGEPIFILRGTDPDSPQVIGRDYVDRVIDRGCDAAHVKAALDHADRMLKWQQRNPSLVKAKAD
jgi:hypothetical protein